MKRRPQDADHSKQLADAARRLARAREARDAAIVAADEDGMPRTHIAEDVDLSTMQVGRIAKAASGAEGK